MYLKKRLVENLRDSAFSLLKFKLKCHILTVRSQRKEGIYNINSKKQAIICYWEHFITTDVCKYMQKGGHIKSFVTENVCKIFKKKMKQKLYNTCKPC